MIEGAVQEIIAEQILRLISLPPATVESVLLKRGIDPNSLDDAKEAMASVGMPFSAEDAVAFAFKSKDELPPYSVGRFGNGQYPVYYSALDEDTCVEEVKHHRQDEFQQQLDAQLPYARYFQIVVCDFSGSAMVLVGHEQQHPDLISPTDAGYRYCQQVAQWSKLQGAAALRTSSARLAGGTCVPVFQQECLANARGASRYRFAVAQGAITYERLPRPF